MEISKPHQCPAPGCVRGWVEVKCSGAGCRDGHTVGSDGEAWCRCNSCNGTGKERYKCHVCHGNGKLTSQQLEAYLPHRESDAKEHRLRQDWLHKSEAQIRRSKNEKEQADFESIQRLMARSASNSDNRKRHPGKTFDVKRNSRTMSTLWTVLFGILLLPISQMHSLGIINNVWHYSFLGMLLAVVTRTFFVWNWNDNRIDEENFFLLTKNKGEVRIHDGKRKVLSFSLIIFINTLHIVFSGYPDVPVNHDFVYGLISALGTGAYYLSIDFSRRSFRATK